MTIKRNVPARSTELRSIARTLVLAGFVATGLAGCKHDEYTGQVAGWTLVDPEQRHPIIVSRQPQTMPFNVAHGSQGLTPQQRAALLGFADKARASDAGNSRVIIQTPTGSRNEVAAMHAVGDIRRILSDRGFADDLVQVEPYSEAGEEPPVKVSYMRYIAEGPTCNHWSENLAFNPQNLPAPNMGCATQHNLAAMVANPADLLGPRTETDRPSERRQVTWEKYVKGESSTAQKSEDEQVSTKNTDN